MSIKLEAKTFFSDGFTIIELLVVIVVISVLAAITVISYIGVTQKSTDALLKSSLASASKQIDLFQVVNGYYPMTIWCGIEDTLINKCINSNSEISYGYTVDDNINPQAFVLTATKNGTSYKITENSSPVPIAQKTCPVGFIVVPGSLTYGTSDFCVMKYEAKMASATVPISQASGFPWVSISQVDAIAYSQNVSGCISCHLISEDEWLTIAQNLLNVASNWSMGIVGSGYIYSGHDDNVPANSLEASLDDNDGYFGTGDVFPSNQKRTLTLSNGEIIWDLPGNIYEWTSGTIAVDKQPGKIDDTLYYWREWNDSLLVFGSLPNSTLPWYGVPAYKNWTSVNGVGEIYSKYNAAVAGPHGFLRGGRWNTAAGVNPKASGVMSLALDRLTTYVNAGMGFRVAAP